MAIKTGIMRFARNKKRGKNGQKLFCLSTKTCLERAKTIMAIRYKKWLLDTKDGENGIIGLLFCRFYVLKMMSKNFLIGTDSKFYKIFADLKTLQVTKFYKAFVLTGVCQYIYPFFRDVCYRLLTAVTLRVFKSGSTLQFFP